MSDLDTKGALIAMSGGTDSSVAAFLMVKQGYECAGLTMELFGCGPGVDADDAKKAAELLGIAHYTADFKESFYEDVIGRFVGAYITGETPNPCVDCNRFVKFKKILEFADRLGFCFMATGHYAKIEQSGGRWLLKKGADEKKDQSYVLYSLTQKQLARIIFPLGGLTKPQVREIAAERGLTNAYKKESQDICFASKSEEGGYAAFIERHTGKNFPEGDFVDTGGKALGRHRGIIRYTIGQRKGLGPALPGVMYVLDKDAGSNTVVLCREEELYAKTLDAGDMNLIALDRIEGGMKVKAKIRYNQPEQDATVWQTGEDVIHVEFDFPQRAITKGQAVVLYDGDVVVGGGKIVGKTRNDE